MPEEDEASNATGVIPVPPPALCPPPPSPSPALCPPPPPPPPALCPPPPPALCPLPPSLVKSRFFKKVAESSDPSVGGCEELKKFIKTLQDRLNRTLKWLLYNQHIPSLIQEGPQCGLVALWMAGALLHNTNEVTLDTIAQMAMKRGYTMLGEMFSAANMACLAEGVFGCRCELLPGGMEGENRARILCHLTAGLPVLIPYDEDFNHEPCQREGHRAHWAVISGVLLGMQNGSLYPDPEVPGLYYPPPNPPALHSGDIDQIYLIAKQGKSLRYQLWEYGSVSRSNSQLLHLDPKRASDGNVYVIPEGGVQDGLCGKVLLLKPSKN